MYLPSSSKSPRSSTSNNKSAIKWSKHGEVDINLHHGYDDNVWHLDYDYKQELQQNSFRSTAPAKKSKYHYF